MRRAPTVSENTCNFIRNCLIRILSEQFLFCSPERIFEKFFGRISWTNFYLRKNQITFIPLDTLAEIGSRRISRIKRNRSLAIIVQTRRPNVISQNWWSGGLLKYFYNDANKIRAGSIVGETIPLCSWLRGFATPQEKAHLKLESPL